MEKNWKIGLLFGIPLFIDPSWFFILIFVTIVNTGDLDPTYRSVVAWVTGAIMALLLFGSVLLHELGHSLAARSQGI
ncbi:MAG TPA: site-2 protease family protein, partial [Cyanobacteria bacterium UBA11153]|nr:site-2 protease family protein [Cyanobacteria bacterium UBA11153]